MRYRLDVLGSVTGKRWHKTKSLVPGVSEGLNHTCIAKLTAPYHWATATAGSQHQCDCAESEDSFHGRSPKVWIHSVWTTRVRQMGPGPPSRAVLRRIVMMIEPRTAHVEHQHDVSVCLRV